MRKLACIQLTLLCFLCVACSTTSTVSRQTTAPSPPATSTPVPMTPTPTGPASLPLQTVSMSAVNQACGSDFAHAGDELQLIGNMVLDISAAIPFAYTKAKLPDDLSTHAPYPANYPLQPSASPIVNPNLAYYGFTLGICNIAPSATYQLQAMSIQVASFTAYGSAKTNVAIGGACGAVFELPNQVIGGGCGGKIAPTPQQFAVTWPSGVTTGTAVSMDQIATFPGPASNAKQVYGKLPLTFKPGNFMPFYLKMDHYPSADGIYTFTFGLKLSGYAMTYASITTAQYLLLPDALNWDGIACMQASTLKAMMTPNKTYVCPNA